MKLILIIANVAAAVGLYLLGSVAVAAHHTHAYSVYQELKIQHVLVERPDYDVEQRLRTIADGGMYSLWVAEVGSGICLMNAIVIGIFFRKPRESIKSLSKKDITKNYGDD